MCNNFFHDTQVRAEAARGVAGGDPAADRRGRGRAAPDEGARPDDVSDIAGSPASSGTRSTATSRTSTRCCSPAPGTTAARTRRRTRRRGRRIRTPSAVCGRAERPLLVLRARRRRCWRWSSGTPSSTLGAREIRAEGRAAAAADRTPRSRRGAPRRARGRALLGVALDFRTWKRLAREGGLSQEAAVETMVAAHHGAVRVEAVQGDITGAGGRRDRQRRQLDACSAAAGWTVRSTARGGPAILEECRAVRAEQHPDGLPTGQAVATTAGDLPARWVIHTVGPVYAAVDDPAELLASCHVESLRVADELGAKTVAFPAISTGVYGYPLEEAAPVAVAAVRRRRHGESSWCASCCSAKRRTGCSPRRSNFSAMRIVAGEHRGRADLRAEGQGHTPDVGSRPRGRLQPDRPGRRRDRARPLCRLRRDGPRGALAWRGLRDVRRERPRGAAGRSSGTSRSCALTGATVVQRDVLQALATDRRTLRPGPLRPALRVRRTRAPRALPRQGARARRAARLRDRTSANEPEIQGLHVRTSRTYGSARLTLFEH